MVVAMAENKFNVEILKHEKRPSGYFMKHKALVSVSGWNGNKQVLLETVTDRIGFSASYYGIYGSKVSKSAKDGQYILVWETEINDSF